MQNNIDEARKKKKNQFGGLAYFPNPGSPEGIARFNGRCPNCKPKADEPVPEAEPVADTAGEAVGAEGGASGGEAGAAVGESFELDEAKRYVRRYYIRPQNIFCSNKAEILKALVDIGDQNCSIYTLNNLTDNNQVAKLTNADIIYYYDEGILYDKNHVKVMDYDLYVKHEEERKKLGNLNDKVAGNSSAEAVYDDRITDATNVEEALEEAFNLNFDAINAYGENLTEAKRMEDCCCICGEPLNGYGNNPAPYIKDGRCCDACNSKFVIPARIDLMRQAENPNGEEETSTKEAYITESLPSSILGTNGTIDPALLDSWVPTEEDFAFIKSAYKAAGPHDNDPYIKGDTTSWNSQNFSIMSKGICYKNSNGVSMPNKLFKVYLCALIVGWKKLQQDAKSTLTAKASWGYSLTEADLSIICKTMIQYCISYQELYNRFSAAADDLITKPLRPSPRHPDALQVRTNSDLYSR